MTLLLAEGLPIDGFAFDTALAAYLLDATGSDYSFERITPRYLGRDCGGAEAVWLLEPVLREEDTYDAAAVRVRILDADGNIASYAQLPVAFSAEGGVSLLGPLVVTAEGAMCGNYVRTAETGGAKLTVMAEGLAPVTVPFRVE